MMLNCIIFYNLYSYEVSVSTVVRRCRSYKNTYISSNLTHISIITLHVQMRINLFFLPLVCSCHAAYRVARWQRVDCLTTHHRRWHLLLFLSYSYPAACRGALHRRSAVQLAIVGSMSPHVPRLFLSRCLYMRMASSSISTVLVPLIPDACQQGEGKGDAAGGAWWGG